MPQSVSAVGGHERAKIVTFSEDDMGTNLYDLGLGNGFLDVTAKAIQQKKKQIKCTSSKLINFENFHSAKDIIKTAKRPNEWEKIFVNHVFYKGLVFRIPWTQQEHKKKNKLNILKK